MLEGFDFGTPTIASQLTGRLSDLKRYNGVRIPSDYFEEAMERLRNRYLNIPLSAVLHPASLAAQHAATEEKAAAEAAPIVQENELTAQQWFERGYAATDHDEEIRFLTAAIRLQPDYAKAFSNRGLARVAQGDIEGAIRDFTEAIRLQPNLAVAFNNRGNARSDQGDLALAITDYTEAIRLQPDFADAFYNRGNARSAKGDIEEAISDYTEAIRLRSDHAKAFYNRAVARLVQGDLAGAEQDFNQAERLESPSSP